MSGLRRRAYNRISMLRETANLLLFTDFLFVLKRADCSKALVCLIALLEKLRKTLAVHHSGLCHAGRRQCAQLLALLPNDQVTPFSS